MLIRKIEQFLRRHDMPPTKFGRLAAHDPRLVLDLRMGREPRTAMKQRVEHFMTNIRDGPMSAKMRRTTSDRVRAALGSLAQAHAQVVAHSETAWASATFSGTRHRIELTFDGAEAREAGEHLIAHLPEHEFAIPGHLVADATVVEVDHRLDREPRLAVVAELLLLEES